MPLENAGTPGYPPEHIGTRVLPECVVQITLQNHRCSHPCWHSCVPCFVVGTYACGRRLNLHSVTSGAFATKRNAANNRATGIPTTRRERSVGGAAGHLTARRAHDPAHEGRQLPHIGLRWRVGRAKQPRSCVLRPPKASHTSGRTASGRGAG